MILALDFDGVICDGLLEYFQTTQKACSQIWQPETTEHLAEKFYQLRPVIETGWEMPVLLRALKLNYSEAEILENWPTIRDKIINSEQIDRKKIGSIVDTIRDQWIETDLESWLNLHRFYPGIPETIKKILQLPAIQLYIITTKEGRFVKQLLHQANLELDSNLIIGKESKKPKYETIRQLIKASGDDQIRIFFIEDRLEALNQVCQQPDLETVELFLADWGYNTAKVRKSITNHPRIKLLSLQEFNQEFFHWL